MRTPKIKHLSHNNVGCQRDASRTILTGFQVVAVLHKLGLQEVRRDVLVGPTFDSVFGPVIVVMPTTPGVHHTVNAGAAAQALTTGPEPSL